MARRLDRNAFCPPEQERCNLLYIPLSSCTQDIKICSLDVMAVPLFHFLVCSCPGASKMSWNTVGKREASGSSASSSLALASSFSKTLPPSLTTGHKLSLCGCVLQCNSYKARLLGLLSSAFLQMKSFLPFVNRF